MVAKINYFTLKIKIKVSELFKTNIKSIFSNLRIDNLFLTDF